MPQIKINPETGKIINPDQQEKTIEYCFMFLNNLTSDELGQKHLMGEDKTQFIILESIFGMQCYFNKNTIFDFASNVVANMACLADCRKFMVDHMYIEAIVVQLVSKYLNAHRRKFLITCLRNILFEYKKFEKQFLELNVPRGICKVLIDEQGLLKDNLHEDWHKHEAK